MGYVLVAISALVMPLFVWFMAGSVAEDQGALIPWIHLVWSLFPFAVLRVLYRSCPTVEQRVMFFSGAMAVLMLCLMGLLDCAVTGQQSGLLDMLSPLLPLYISVALLAFRILAWTVDYFYQLTPHRGGQIGWGVDTKKGAGG